MASTRIAVIGGGPKAAAICTKVACLRQLARQNIDVTIFEKNVIGAAWTGNHGYTDGQQQLCTPAERDVGFPYSRISFGEQIAHTMHKRFSWNTFAEETNRIANWVDRGRPRPTHVEFAEYISFCVAHSRAIVTAGNVTGLAPRDGRWEVRYESDPPGAKESENGFDAVVVTGSGPAKGIPGMPVDRRIYDGVSMWRNLGRIDAEVQVRGNNPVVIIGSGGTAAAAAAWLAKRRINTEIIILGSQAALYARSDSAFENRVFSDPGIWQALGANERKKFSERLIRGSVWDNVLDILGQARNVRYLPGRATRVRYEPPEDVNGEIMVEFATTGQPGRNKLQPARLVIDATGFDATWFASLLPDAIRQQIVLDPDRMSRGMRLDLSLPLDGALPLHAPGISWVVSPAFTSLMALGDMSDAILRPYVVL